jgi:hypothetical protein
MTKPVEAIAMIDLGDLDTVAGSNAGAEVELKHPTTGKPTGIFVGILGKHSDVFREIVRERTNNRVKAAAEASKAGDDEPTLTAEQIEERAIELLTACTTNWRSETRNAKGEVIDNKPVIKFKGEELTFSVVNAKRLYTHFIWMREQIDGKIGDLDLFIKA